MPRLRRSDCSGPGVSRRRHGRGFRYTDHDGRTVEDPEVLARIEALAIPPAWKHVWICADPRGHLQATGIDAAGRKQYRYHDDWRTHRDRLKFEAMIDFGRSLPRLRRRVRHDLRAADLERSTVLACAVRLLDLGFFRIGSEDYTERNESYGLTTLLKRHVRLRADEAVFDYTAKSGVRRVQAIADAEVLAVLARLKRRRGGGEQLLVSRSADGWSVIHSDEVNDYIKRLTGGSFTAKDFRTWNATVLAAVALAAQPGGGRRARERHVAGAVKTVAAYLGNTPAVCRASYIDPRIVDSYLGGHTVAPTLERLPSGPSLEQPRTRARIEAAVLELLAD